MRRTFVLNTEPHIAEIGDIELAFLPEVMGDAFISQYEQLKDSQGDIDFGNLDDVDPAQLRGILGSMKVFLAGLMLPESAEVFARWDVLVEGKAVGSYHHPAEAARAAERAGGGTVVDAGLRVPDRLLVELLEWVVELYGSGAGARPTGSSSGSAPASPSPGTRGKVRSRSRA